MAQRSKARSAWMDHPHVSFGCLALAERQGMEHLGLLILKR
jgi:hypothetical protein